MKYGVIITRANYPIGSWSNRIRMIAKGLLYHKLSVDVLVTAPWPTKENIANSEEFVTYITKPSIKKENIISVFKQLFTLYKLYKKLMQKEYLDFILLTGDRFLDGLVLLLVSKKRKVKLFVEIVDEVGRQFDPGSKSFYDILAIWNRKAFYYLLNKYDKIFVITKYLQLKLQKKIKDKSKIVMSSPTYIDEQAFNYNATNYDIIDIIDFPKQDGNVIISYAGSCLRPNGLFFFLDNLAELIKEKKYNVFVVFIFHIGNILTIQNYIKKLNLEKNVHIYRTIHPKYIPSLYMRSDILLLPEQGDIVANAGFPGKTGEYLISGKAIISTNFSDLNLYLKNGKNCMISEIGDSKVYKNNLSKLISDAELRINIGKNARKTALKFFDYKNAVKIYLNEINM